MNAVTDDSRAIDLAREPDFRLGELLVRPSTCKVVAAGREQRLEPRVMEVLVFLARAGDRTVTRDELIAACWGGRFIGDDAVNRVLSRVRGLARGLEPSPFVLETVPKVGFRLIMSAPDGAVAPAPEQAARRPAGPTAPVIAAALAAALLAGAAGWAAWRGIGPGPAENGRVEVMPFETLQPDPALQRYSVGLGDAVVRVLTSNGVQASEAPRDAGGRPGDAEFRIAGTVDRDGETYVVNAQVLERRSGEVLWSGRFDRAAASPVGFHEEAANRIGDNLYCALWHRAAERKPVPPATFSLFLNACAARPRLTFSDPRLFLAATSRLAQAAPDLSYAQSLHAVALALVAGDGLTSPSEAASMSRAAEAAAQRALRLNSRNAEAYRALGERLNGWARWGEREQNFLRALELDPHLIHGRNYYVGMLHEVGRWEEATEVIRQGIAADPFSPYLLSALAQKSAAAGDLREADAVLQRLELIHPEWAQLYRRQIALWWEDPRDGLPKLRRYAGERSPQELLCQEAYLARLIQARGAPLRGLPDACAPQGDYRIRMLARQGDVDGAYAALAATPPAGLRFPNLFFYPEMKAFRADPRFMPLAHRLGLVDYWATGGRWPDFCSEPDLPYDCKAAAKALGARGAAD